MIGRFNQTVAKAQQLLGNKAIAVRNLLFHLPPDVFSFLHSHVAQHGWEQCALSDDNLASKKILPNFVFKPAHKCWKPLCIEGNPSASRKLPKMRVEQTADCEEFPILMTHAETEILDQCVANHAGLELEMHESFF